MNRHIKTTIVGMMLLPPINEMDRISYNFSSESPKMPQDGMHMFTEVVLAMHAAWFLYEAFDIDVRIAQTTIYAKAANHKDYISRHTYSTKSGFRLRLLGQGIFSQYGIQETQTL